MSDLEDLIQKVAISGQEDVIGGFQSIAEAGQTAFAALAESSVGASIGLASVAGPIGLVVAALTALIYETAKFAEKQAEAQVALDALAEATGVTRDEVKGLEATFGDFGISAEVVARGLQKMAIEISNSWAGISQNVRNAGTEQQEANEAIVSSQINVEESYQRAQQVSSEWANKLQGDALSVTEAFNKVAGSGLGVRSAQLGVEQAEAALSGDKSKQKELDHEQKLLAVDEARQRLKEAQATKSRSELGVSEAEEKQTSDFGQLGPAIERANLGVEKAVTVAAQAQQHAYDHMTTDLDLIVQSLDEKGPLAGKLTDVSGENINKAINLRASRDRAGGTTPTTGQVILDEQGVFQGNALTSGQKIAQVRAQGIGGRTGASAAEAEQAITKGDFVDHMQAATDAHLGGTDEQTKIAHEIVEKIVLGNDHLEQIKKNTALGLGNIGLTIYKMLLGKDSENYSSNIPYKPSDLGHSIGGLIRAFGDGGAVNSEDDPFGFYNRSQGLGGRRDFSNPQKDSISPVGSDAEWLTALSGSSNYGTLIKGASSLWGIFENSMVQRGAMRHESKFADGGFADRISALGVEPGTVDDRRGGKTSLGDTLMGIGQEGFGKFKQGLETIVAQLGFHDKPSDSLATAAWPKFAGGGGTDTIPAWLTPGEFVMKTAAVDHYGAAFMHAINSMSLDGFAMGGLAPRPVRLSEGGTAGPGRTLNLTIGEDKTFKGLTVPEGVAKSLIAYAVDNQVSSTGRQPSWKR